LADFCRDIDGGYIFSDDELINRELVRLDPEIEIVLGVACGLNNCGRGWDYFCAPTG
jgi:hypothetical protein